MSAVLALGDDEVECGFIAAALAATHTDPSPMPSENPLSEKITSLEEFEAGIDQLLAAAASNDVDPRGAWAVHTDTAGPDWEVIIMELKDTSA